MPRRISGVFAAHAALRSRACRMLGAPAALDTARLDLSALEITRCVVRLLMLRLMVVG